MRCLITSMKGGVGKSSISYNLAVHLGCICITNDLTVPQHDDIIQIPTGKNRIPKGLTSLDSAVFDFGAMSTMLDKKISHALQLCDLVIIPTRIDARSLEATLETYKLVKEAGKPIVIIINHFRDWKKHDAARDHLLSKLGNRVPILAIRETTLFDRVSRDGREWLLNIHNDRGAHMLSRTQRAHEVVYDRIQSMAGV
ncbi:hypothetical protein GCM10009104_23700 [Marinobacterium maritimum]|uniref:CobQ/CobB/MinD/ParA nucleotide binding domain-containing protein n=1 Tax=Marinobacterium maritimum TaxID=500162 RepID=A0ABN1I7Q1_9GAMM